MRAGSLDRFVAGTSLSLLSFVASCTTPPPGNDGGDDAAPMSCATDADCDDAIFCNGVELCRPRAADARPNGCVASPTPRCLTGQTCDEAGTSCIADCAVTRDADGDHHQAIACGGDDCDDADPLTYPGNPELCDAGNHDEDCDDTTFGDRDVDHDGIPDMRCCNVRRSDPTMLDCGEDCNDLRRVVNPSTTEACDGFDNDCDGAIDEGVLVTGYLDGDRDGFGTGAGVMVCAGAVGYALDGGDCDDASPAQRPMGAELCDGQDNDCDTTVDESPTAVTWFRDLDGDLYGSARSGTVVSCTPVDGFSLLGTDCDDHARGVNPGATETCNGRDDDCNGVPDYQVHPGDLEDDDMDGYVDSACGAAGDDCDDLDAATHPGAPEFCDGRDNDCNGIGDDLTGMIAWYPDLDGDGWGDSAGTPVTQCVQPAGRVTRALDCDDSDPDRHPGAADLCDARDQDCDADVDEDAVFTTYWMGDLDGDGYAGGAPVSSCSPVAGATTQGGDCDDTRADRRPGATELCNGTDDDCDTSTDESFGSVTCGMASCVRSMPACSAGALTVCTPGTPAPEQCNGADDDCNGTIDDEPAASASCHLAGANSHCMGGLCHVLACTSGFSNCNGADGDGCEAVLASDPLNCGLCGHTCGAGETCSNGHCANDVIDLALGDHHSCALLGSGNVYCWGDNRQGQVGQQSATPFYATAREALHNNGTGAYPPLDLVLGIDASHDSTCTRREMSSPTQRVLCWGRNAESQLGNGNFAPAPPELSASYNTTNFALEIAQVQMGATWQMVRDTSGRLFIGGTSSHYESGTTGLNSTLFAVAVNMAPLTNVTELHCGETFCLARDASSLTATFVWGDDALGQLYLPGATGSSIPVTSIDLGDWRNIAAGRAHTCLIRRATTDVVCFGDNANGQLGAGDTSPRSAMVVTGTSGSIDADAGGDTTCVIDDGGQVVCWGGNDMGQCGVAGPAPVPTPSIVPMPGGIAARLVGVGGHHACAVLATNAIVCWGQNAWGQLGDGSAPTDSVAPVFVAGMP